MPNGSSSYLCKVVPRGEITALAVGDAGDWPSCECPGHVGTRRDHRKSVTALNSNHEGDTSGELRPNIAHFGFPMSQGPKFKTAEFHQVIFCGFFSFSV